MKIFFLVIALCFCFVIFYEPQKSTEILLQEKITLLEMQTKAASIAKTWAVINELKPTDKSKENYIEAVSVLNGIDSKLESVNAELKKRGF